MLHYSLAALLLQSSFKHAKEHFSEWWQVLSSPFFPFFDQQWCSIQLPPICRNVVTGLYYMAKCYQELPVDIRKVILNQTKGSPCPSIHPYLSVCLSSHILSTVMLTIFFCVARIVLADPAVLVKWEMEKSYWVSSQAFGPSLVHQAWCPLWLAGVIPHSQVGSMQYVTVQFDSLVTPMPRIAFSATVTSCDNVGNGLIRRMIKLSHCHRATVSRVHWRGGT